MEINKKTPNLSSSLLNNQEVKLDKFHSPKEISINILKNPQIKIWIARLMNNSNNKYSQMNMIDRDKVMFRHLMRTLLAFRTIVISYKQAIDEIMTHG